jgi:hypothetical protein
MFIFAPLVSRTLFANVVLNFLLILLLNRWLELKALLDL